jgi:hypothetical protein
MSYATSGGTKRYADYTNSNSGQTQFSDAWQKGARYQQLRGASNGTVNDAFNQQFATSKGGDETATVADDGGGWRLIKQDGGSTSNERLEDYRKIAEQWQAAGYDVRVQDHNPTFGKKRQSEIAVRMGEAKEAKDEQEVNPERDPDVVAEEVRQLNEGRNNYDNTRLDKPENNQPRYGFSDDPYKDAIGHGDDLNAHYQNKFIPSLKAEAELTSKEIGFSGRNALNSFVGKVPKLGDPKDLFAYYSDKITESA